MRLALVISGLKTGGAERVATRLANGWAERGCDVVLITFDPVGGEAFPLDPRVQRMSTAAGRPGAWGPLRALQRLLALRRTLTAVRPDAVLGFCDRTNVQTLLAAAGLKAKVVVAERTDPTQYSPGRLWSLLRDWLYPRADALVVQTERVRTWAAVRFPGLFTAVIPNPAPEPQASPVERERVFVGAGRLSHEKGFDRLLRAFATARCALPGWSLEIWGDGPDRARLEDLLRRLGLERHARLCGGTRELPTQLGRAGVFVLSSRFEGFPNVLLEAMTHGAAVLACNCPAGPGEIIRPGLTGLLTPADNEGALADGMIRLAGDAALRRRLGQAAAADVAARFRLTQVLDLWEDTFRGAPRLDARKLHRPAA